MDYEMKIKVSEYDTLLEREERMKEIIRRMNREHLMETGENLITESEAEYIWGKATGRGSTTVTRGSTEPVSGPADSTRYTRDPTD